MTLWVDVIDPDELDERICLTAHVFQTATPEKVADVRIHLARYYGKMRDTAPWDR